MSNAHRGYVPIELGEEEYSLRLDFNALATADQRLGESSLQALGAGRFDALQTLLAAGLQNPRNPRNTTKVLRNLDAGEMEYYMECIMKALEVSGVIRLEDIEDDDPGESSASSKRGKKSGGPTTTTNSGE